MLQQASYCRRRTEKLKIGMMKFLAFTLYLLARIALTLISFSAIIGYFEKVSFKGFNLVNWNFELSYAFLHASFEFFKSGLFIWKYHVLLKIRDGLICVTNRYIKVRSKLILLSVSRSKFCPNYKRRVKRIC